MYLFFYSFYCWWAAWRQPIECEWARIGSTDSGTSAQAQRQSLCPCTRPCVLVKTVWASPYSHCIINHLLWVVRMHFTSSKKKKKLLWLLHGAKHLCEWVLKDKYTSNINSAFFHLAPSWPNIPIVMQTSEADGWRLRCLAFPWWSSFVCPFWRHLRKSSLIQAFPQKIKVLPISKVTTLRKTALSQTMTKSGPYWGGGV